MHGITKRMINMLVVFSTVVCLALNANAKNFEVAYGTVSADGNKLSGMGFNTVKQETGVIEYNFSPSFQHSAVVMFTPLGVRNTAVRIVKHQSQNRKEQVNSDSYNLHTHEGRIPSQQDMPLSFVALAKIDGDYTSGLLRSDQAQLVAYKWINGAVSSQSNVKIARPISTGKYIIEFGEAFDGIPGAVANYNQLVAVDNQGSEPIRTVTVLELKEDYAIIGITDEQGNWVDANFTFIAIGKAAPGVTSGLLSQAEVAYGRYEKGDNESRTFGYNMGTSSKTKPADYEIPFTPEFIEHPFIIANVEHSSENHLRQVQITGSSEKAHLQVVGRTICCGLGAGNDARYDILAIATP